MLNMPALLRQPLDDPNVPVSLRPMLRAAQTYWPLIETLLRQHRSVREIDTKAGVS